MSSDLRQVTDKLSNKKRRNARRRNAAASNAASSLGDYAAAPPTISSSTASSSSADMGASGSGEAGSNAHVATPTSPCVESPPPNTQDGNGGKMDAAVQGRASEASSGSRLNAPASRTGTGQSSEKGADRFQQAKSSPSGGVAGENMSQEYPFPPPFPFDSTTSTDMHSDDIRNREHPNIEPTKPIAPMDARVSWMDPTKSYFQPFGIRQHDPADHDHVHGDVPGQSGASNWPYSSAMEGGEVPPQHHTEYSASSALLPPNDRRYDSHSSGRRRDPHKKVSHHCLHALLCVFCCGLWIPCWIGACTGLCCVDPTQSAAHVCDSCCPTNPPKPEFDMVL